MADRALKARILRKTTQRDEFDVSADLANPAGLQQILTNWLEGKKIHKPLWPEFEAEFRLPGDGKVQAKVRT